MKQTILIIEDDRNIARLIKLYLDKDGFESEFAYDGKEGLEMFHKKNPDLIVLDIMLPKKNGLDLLRDIRKQSKVPIIVISAKGNTSDKIDALEIGADDYMSKPFDVPELMARIKRNLKRQESGESQLVLKDLVIDYQKYEVFYRGEKIHLPLKEMELLFFLAKHPNQVFSREQLIQEIWSYDFLGDSRTIDVHIKRLRDKFFDSTAWKIQTIWGLGYKLEVR